jgi:hypothetical protein
MLMKHKLLSSAGILFNILINVAYPQPMTDVNIQVFPENHALNTPIDQLPVHPNSNLYIESIGRYAHLHPDFGTEWNSAPIGIPYNVVGDGQPLLPITFVSWPEESDAGPWPIPQDPYIETVFDWRENSNGDRHMLIVDTANLMLYETGRTFGNASGTAWEGSCGAVFNLNSNELRPDTWTSADAAGLPIFPLLIRYDEVEHAVQTGGEIPHAIRFTVDTSQQAYVWPARHYASPYTDSKYPPMGMRFRLKAEFDISGFSPRVQAILRTFKKYGIIVSDNGSGWFIQGAYDERWNDEELGELKSIEGSNFEAVDISPWLNSPEFDPNSAAVPQQGVVGIEYQNENNRKLILYQNYPNPFFETTTIAYNLTSSLDIRLEIFNLTGTKLLTFQVANQPAGNHKFTMNMSDFPEGIYFYRLITQDGSATGRCDLIK